MNIKEVANTFKTFDEMYEELFDENVTYFSCLKRKLGTNEYPIIDWLIEHFSKKEEYEKCERLKNLELPKVNDKQIKKEIAWILKNNM